MFQLRNKIEYLTSVIHYIIQHNLNYKINYYTYYMML